MGRIKKTMQYNYALFPKNCAKKIKDAIKINYFKQ